MTFEEVWVVTKNVSYESAYHQDEAQALFDCAISLPTGATVVEIGCQHGRSSSVLAQVSREKQFDLHFIDPFEDFGTAASWITTMRTIGSPFTLHAMKSEDASCSIRLPRVGLLHIDGDHERRGVLIDCGFITDVSPGGFVLAHDYGQDSLPDVFLVMNEMAAKFGLEQIKVVRTLAIWRKP